MNRALALLAFAGLSATVGACGDDSGDNNTTITDAGHDASKSDASTEALSLGTACTADADCTGSGQSCLKTLPTLPTVPGGYCSATCTTSSDCGSTGDCPTGDALANSTIQASGQGAMISALLPQVCLESCTVGDAGGQGSCTRSGYVCTTIANSLVPESNRAAFGALAGFIPTFGKTYCLPNTSSGDAGTGDAGAALVLGGIDAGL